MDSKKIKIVVHDGIFHADDVFAVATYLLYEEKKGNTSYEIIRTRDEKIISEADIVIDVGRVYDPSKKRFDHHQPEGAGVRKNGIPYAAFGLIWKEFGEFLCNSEGEATDIDRTLVSATDAEDNGFEISDPRIEDIDAMSLDQLVGYFNPTWREDFEDQDKRFLDMVDLAKRIVKRAVDKEGAERLAQDYVEEKYQESEDKRMIVLDKAVPWKKALIRKLDPLFVVFPYQGIEGRWVGYAVPLKLGTFEYRAYFPESWAGLVDEELEQISGIPRAKFCHKGRHLVSAGDKETVIKLVQLAINKLK